MSQVTMLLDAVNRGDHHAAAELLPLVYDQLKQIAAAKLRREKSGHTLNATALVHEAYLRLVGPRNDGSWTGCGSFLAAAAEAMRRILIDSARRKLATKRGTKPLQFEILEGDLVGEPDLETILAIDEALMMLDRDDTSSATIARLRLFTGLSVDEASDAMGISRAAAFRDWAYARAFLTAALSGISVSP